MLLVYAKDEVLLTTETELLDRLVDHRLQTTGRGPVVLHLDDPEKKRKALETIAFHLWVCRDGKRHARPQLLALLTQVLEEWAQAGTPLYPVGQASYLLSDLTRNSGLLREEDGGLRTGDRHLVAVPDRLRLGG